jgi:uncharacterized membrane protein YeiH
VTGGTTALVHGAGTGQAILLGTINAAGGGTIRDVLVRRVPSVLSSELYAIPAMLGAAVVVLAARAGVGGLVWTLVGAALALVVRLVGVGFRLNAPRPPGGGPADREAEG